MGEKPGVGGRVHQLCQSLLGSKAELPAGEVQGSVVMQQDADVLHVRQGNAGQQQPVALLQEGAVGAVVVAEVDVAHELHCPADAEGRCGGRLLRI